MRYHVKMVIFGFGMVLDMLGVEVFALFGLFVIFIYTLAVRVLVWNGWFVLLETEGDATTNDIFYLRFGTRIWTSEMSQFIYNDTPEVLIYNRMYIKLMAMKSNSTTSFASFLFYRKWAISYDVSTGHLSAPKSRFRTSTGTSWFGSMGIPVLYIY